MGSYRFRRFIVVTVLLLIAAITLSQQSMALPTLEEIINNREVSVPAALNDLPVKGRAPKTGYARSQFGEGWATNDSCDTRNTVLTRDLTDVVHDDRCRVLTGKLSDPYTGKIIPFQRGETTSDDVQIDHVVALSNAWQPGAQQLTYERRV